MQVTTYAPVVSVLGHVDHGKTTLLDKIRETGVAARETGGITQKIGASEIEIKHEGKVRKITFIDTPGHAAFENMRSQGVNAADIVLLIIAADDGVMPQTRESIIKILEAKIPFIVVFTKIDMEGANIERVKQTVVKDGILLEGLGGDVPYIGVSAKTGEKVPELLELIILAYDMNSVKKTVDSPFFGVVIDAKADRRRGIVATVVVKNGKIAVGNDLFTHGRKIGKVRALINTKGEHIKEAIPGNAVEILGATEILPAGSILFDREMELEIRPEVALAETPPLDVMAFLNAKEKDIIPIILKTETSAEMEAVINSLPEKVRIISSGEGEIVVSDVLMAKDFHALLVGFNVDATREAQNLALSEKIFYKSYKIIYEMLDELETLLDALNQEEAEKELGRGQILASFVGTTGAILGTKVIKGRLAVGDKIKIMRAEKLMGESVITSIKKGKADVKLAENNVECGIMIAPDIDFAPQDVIIAYSKK